jgi:hypothetical protein
VRADGLCSRPSNPIAVALLTREAAPHPMKLPHLPHSIRRATTALALATLATLSTAADLLAQSLSVSPAQSNATLMNPLRGYFRWRGEWTVPQPGPALDHYDRLYWTDLEGSTQGSYNMQKIYDGIATAKAIGGPKAKYAFRIRCMQGPGDSGTHVPLYVRNLMPRGWNTTDGAYIPDWNDSDFINRYNALLTRVAQEFDGHPDIAYIDIGTYGCWGEWHTSGLSYPRSTPNGTADKATTATLQAYVDGYVSAFTQTRLIMMTDNETALVHAMSKVPTGNTPWIGWRRDSLANTHFATGLTTAKRNAIQDRWQKAPVIAETINSARVDPTLVPSQITDWHVSALGNGNIGSWSNWSSAQQAYFVDAEILMGYRFVLSNLTIAQTLTPGAAFTVQSSWKNVGNAPAYEPFTITYQLRSGSTIVWQGASALDLEGFLPTGSTATTINDPFTLPSSLAAGSYTFAVVVPSLDGSRDPIKLAITTPRNSDGSYTLGTVNVAATAYVGTIDNFDDGNVTSPAWTTAAGTGGTVSIVAQAVSSSQPAAPDGSAYHAIIDFGTAATWKYAVLNRGTATFGATWAANGVNALRFNLKGSTANPTTIANNALRLQLREGETGDRWSFDLGTAVQTNHSNWTTITVPLSSFYGESSNPSGAVLNLSAVDQIRFFNNAINASVKLRVDRIQAISQ